MSSVKWYIGSPRKLWFTVGALGASDKVYLEHYAPSANSPVVSLEAVITDRTTGVCYLVFTPAEAGNYRFWPKITDANDAIVNIGQAVVRTVFSLGT